MGEVVGYGGRRRRRVQSAAHSGSEVKVFDFLIREDGAGKGCFGDASLGGGFGLGR